LASEEENRFLLPVREWIFCSNRLRIKCLGVNRLGVDKLFLLFAAGGKVGEFVEN